MTPNEYFKKWLVESDVRQKDVAQAAGVTDAVVVFWKNGRMPFAPSKALMLESAYKDKGLCASKLCPVIKEARSSQ